MSIIDDGGGRRVRMSHLAIVGSHKVNGVAQLHSDIMRKYVFRDFAQMYPGPLHQRDQRHRRAALAQAIESRAFRAAHATFGPGVGK